MVKKEKVSRKKLVQKKANAKNVPAKKEVIEKQRNENNAKAKWKKQDIPKYERNLRVWAYLINHVDTIPDDSYYIHLEEEPDISEVYGYRRKILFKLAESEKKKFSYVLLKSNLCSIIAPLQFNAWYADR